MPRSIPATTALSIRRFIASICVLVLLAAISAVPGADLVPGELFTPAAAASPWDQLGDDIDGAAAGDQSGFSVALSDDGSRLAVGAIRDDGTYGGYVRVYHWHDDEWEQLGADIEAESSADELGFSVALSADGSRLAVGARLNGGAASLAGHVRVFEWSGATWQQLGADIDGEAQYEQAGYSVALSDDGNRLAIGAPGAASNRGAVRVFAWSGSAWNQLGDSIEGESASDTAGWSLALSGDGSRLAVGTPGHDGSAPNAGRVAVYDWSGSAWTPSGAVDGEAQDDFSGRAVSLSADGARLAVGAAKNDDAGSDAGHVRVYSWSGSAWIQLGPDVDGEDENDQSGRSVALSADGSRLAVGASGVGAGRSRVFLWSGSAWIQLGENVDGEAEGDRAGSSVALSANGGAIAVGATGNDGAGENAGQVRVHGSMTPSPVPGPPSGVSGVPADSEITVTWSPPLFTGGSAITNYTATASPGDASCSTTGGLSCTIDGLTNGTTYALAVTATNSFGTGPAAGPPAGVMPATVPEAPITAAATLTDDTEALVWWAAPLSDGGSAIAGYTATASPGDATCTTSGALSCEVTGLTAGVAHTFTVTATNSIGTGPPSPPSAPIVATAPGAPFAVVAVGGDAEAWVSWAAPLSDGSSAITDYTATATPGGETCSTSGALSCVVDGLTNGVAHTFTVTATNGMGTGLASAPSNPVTPETPTSVPGAPSSVIATAHDAAANVSWSAPPSDGGTAATGFTVTAAPGGATCTTTTALTCDVTGLTNGVTYSFTVTAQNSVGTGPASSPSNPVTPVAPSTAPGAPTGVAATAGDGDAAVAWTAPAADGGEPITAYTVTAAPGPRTCTTAGAVSCEVTGLTNGVTYTFTVTATNRVGVGPASSPSTAVTPTAVVVASGPPSPSPSPPTAACPSPAVPFDDIANVISRNDIACIYGLGITTGTAPTNYSPDTYVDRDQMASFLARLWRAAGLDCPTPTIPFDDTANVISRNDIACIYGLGITTGTAPTNYSPDTYVDRDQMASFLARLWRALGES